MIRTEEAKAQAEAALRPVREALNAWGPEPGMDAESREARGAVQRALDDAEHLIAGMHDRAGMLRSRVAWLEAEQRRDPSSAVLGQLEHVFKAAGDALMQQRITATDGLRARAHLDDEEVAVVIDSLTAMRDRLREGDHPAPNVESALRKIGRMVDPATTVVEVTA